MTRSRPVLAAVIVLLAALGAAIAASVLLGTHTLMLLDRSCPVGFPVPPPCPPLETPVRDLLDPNLWAGVAAFAVVLATGAGLVMLSRRRLAADSVRDHMLRRRGR